MSALRRAVALALLLVPLALAVLLGIALLSETGSRRLAAALPRLVPGLEIEYASGSLARELRLDRVRFVQGGMTLQLTGLVIAPAHGCLWRSELCFRELSADALTLDFAANTDDEHKTQDRGAGEPRTRRLRIPVAMSTGDLRLGSIDIRWPGGSWQQDDARLAVRLRDSRLEVQSVRAARPRLQIDTSDGDTNSDVRVRLPRVALPFTLAVAALTLDEPTLAIGQWEQPFTRVALSGTWEGTRLTLVRNEAALPDFGELTLAGTLNMDGDWPISADVSLLTAAPANWPGWLVQRRATAKVSGTLAALAIAADAPGAPSLALQLNADTLAPGLPFQASATVDELAPALATVTASIDLPQLLKGLAVAAPVAVTANGTRHEQTASLSTRLQVPGYTEMLALATTARHADRRVEITQLEMADDARAVASKNALSATGEVSWAEGLHWSFAVDSPGLQLPPITAPVSGRLQGSLRASGSHGRASHSAGQWSLALDDVAVTGELGGYPARVMGNAALSNAVRSDSSQPDTFRLDTVRLGPSALDAELNGARLRLTQAADANAPGQLALVIDDLGRWHADAAGAVKLDAELAQDRYRASGELRALRWRETRIGHGALQAEYRPDSNRELNATLSLAAVEAGGARWQRVVLTAQGDAARQQLTISADGDVQGELTIAGEGTVDRWQGRLLPTRLDVTGKGSELGDWVLAEPVPLSWTRAEPQLAIAAHCWRHSDAALCPGDWRLGAAGGGTLAATGDLALFTPLLAAGPAISGPFTLELNAGWQPGASPHVDTALQISAPTISVATASDSSSDGRRFGWDAARARLVLREGALDIDATLQRAGRDELAATLQLPAARTGQLAGTLAVRQLSLAGFGALLPPPAQLTGTIDGDLRLAGTLTAPRAYGRLTLSDGSLARADNPTALTALALVLQFNGDTANLDGQGLLGGGALRLTGAAALAGTPRLTLNLTGRDNTLLYPPAHAELVVSPALRMTATPELVAVDGEVRVTGGTIVFSQLPEGSVELSPDVVRVDGDVVSANASSAMPVRMNVRVPVDDRLRLTGTLVETTLGGELQLRQEPGQPLQAFGSISATGGELRAYQHRLELKRGVLSFSGAPDNPTLDLRAERRINRDNVTAGIQLQGPVQQELVLDVYAEPAMSQGDAMSYLVRGRPLDAGAGVDSTATALSLAGGVLNRTELVHQLNKVPGVSDIAFGAEGSDDQTAATVSGYLGERLYLSYGLGLYEPVNTLTTRLYLQARLWVEVVSRLENTVDLYYSFDLD